MNIFSYLIISVFVIQILSIIYITYKQTRILISYFRIKNDDLKELINKEYIYIVLGFDIVITVFSIFIYNCEIIYNDLGAFILLSYVLVIFNFIISIVTSIILYRYKVTKLSYSEKDNKQTVFVLTNSIVVFVIICFTYFYYVFLEYDIVFIYNVIQLIPLIFFISILMYNYIFRVFMKLFHNALKSTIIFICLFVSLFYSVFLLPINKWQNVSEEQNYKCNLKVFGLISKFSRYNNCLFEIYKNDRLISSSFLLRSGNFIFDSDIKVNFFDNRVEIGNEFHSIWIDINSNEVYDYISEYNKIDVKDGILVIAKNKDKNCVIDEKFNKYLCTNDHIYFSDNNEYDYKNEVIFSSKHRFFNTNGEIKLVSGGNESNYMKHIKNEFYEFHDYDKYPSKDVYFYDNLKNILTVIPETNYITSIIHKSDTILVVGVDRNVKTVFLDADRNFLMKADYVVDNIEEINDKLYIDFRIFSKMKLDGNSAIVYKESEYSIERYIYDINDNTLRKLQ